MRYCANDADPNAHEYPAVKMNIRSESNEVHGLARLPEKKGHGSSLALAALQLSRAPSSGRESADSQLFDRAPSTHYVGFQHHEESRASPFDSDLLSSTHDYIKGIDVAVRPGYGVKGSSSGTDRGDFQDCKSEAIYRQGFADDPSMSFIGIFEGHGNFGKQLALDIAVLIPRVLEDELKLLGLQRCSDEAIKLSLSHACSAAQNRILSSNYDVSSSGVYACFGLILVGRAFIANIGNGRCILVSERPVSHGLTIEKISQDGNPSSPVELERIQSHGGAVGRFEDSGGIPYGSLRVFKVGSKVLPGVTSSRMMGHMRAMEIGISSEPFISECKIGLHTKYMIFASESAWGNMGEDDAARIVSQYSKHKIDENLSAADILSFHAQASSPGAREHAQADEVCVVVVYFSTIQPSTKVGSNDLCNDAIKCLIAARTNIEASSQVNDDDDESREEKFKAKKKAYAKLESICHLNDTGGDVEIFERKSSLTQAMRGDSGDIASPASLSQDDHRQPGAEKRRDSQNQSFIPSAAIGVPIGGTIQSQRHQSRNINAHQSAPLHRVLSEEELPPIRKAHLSYLNLNGSLEGHMLSQRSLSQQDVWMLDGVDTPRSSDSNGSGCRAGMDFPPHRRELRHEGKVHRGVPCSYSSLRLSSDSDSSLGRWGSLDSSLQELTIAASGDNVISPSRQRLHPGSYTNRGSFSPQFIRSLSLRRPKSMASLQALTESSAVEANHSVQRTSSNVVILKDLNKFFN